MYPYKYKKYLIVKQGHLCLKYQMERKVILIYRKALR